MTIGGITLTRDSLVWWVMAAGAMLGYLAVAKTPPTQWSYEQWLQAGLAGVGWLSGYLKSSPLPLSYKAQAALSTGDSYRDIPAATNPPPPPPQPPVPPIPDPGGVK